MFRLKYKNIVLIWNYAILEYFKDYQNLFYLHDIYLTSAWDSFHIVNPSVPLACGIHSQFFTTTDWGEASSFNKKLSGSWNTGIDQFVAY